MRGWGDRTANIPPNCRDPRDLPVLATAIDGRADVIVSGNNDLRDDEVLRSAIAIHQIRLLGVNFFLASLETGLES
ncbi:PIN domain-containing protein [Thermocoleostomius sinensis]|uniref:PIN domain-containing protein n=1 Tax=Thermocoleostomius sinensis TaxID=3065396 RepID=UPI0036F35789